MKVSHPNGTRIATLSGAVVVLAPGEVRDLPEPLGLLALSKGAHQVVEDGEAAVSPKLIPADTDQEPTLVPPKPPEATRHDRLVAVMKTIIDRADPSDFRADKTPKASIVSRLFGEPVADDERTKAFDEAMRKA